MATAPAPRQRWTDAGSQRDGSVYAAARPHRHPLGYYMLFIVDTNGIPSVAATLYLG